VVLTINQTIYIESRDITCRNGFKKEKIKSSIQIFRDYVEIGFKSLVYQNALLYNFVNQRAYDFKTKFRTIASIACLNGTKKILDLPCGTGYLTRYLDNNITYIGWDLNRTFLEKIKRDWKKGRILLNKVILEQKNIFDFKDYPNDVDVIVFCDILHHVYPNHVKLVENAKKYAKKIIICEPVAVKPEHMNVKDWIARAIIKIVKYMPERIIKFIDYFLADNDGINNYINRANWPYNRTSLREFYINLGIKVDRILEIGDETLGVWES